MPTTLFVLVNAVINSFRLVDHIVVMTKGGPDNATSLLLFYIYEVGFKFWDHGLRGGADPGAAGDPGRGGARPVRAPRPAGALPVTRPGAALETRGRLAAWACSGSCRWPTRSGPRSIPPSSRRASCSIAPLTLENFANAWNAAPFARYFVNTFMLVTMILAAQLVLCTLAAYAFARFAFAGASRRRSCSCWCSS